jgi:hypothetical protein
MRGLWHRMEGYVVLDGCPGAEELGLVIITMTRSQPPKAGIGTRICGISF